MNIASNKPIEFDRAPPINASPGFGSALIFFLWPLISSCAPTDTSEVCVVEVGERASASALLKSWKKASVIEGFNDNSVVVLNPIVC